METTLWIDKAHRLGTKPGRILKHHGQSNGNEIKKIFLTEKI